MGVRGGPPPPTSLSRDMMGNGSKAAAGVLGIKSLSPHFYLHSFFLQPKGSRNANENTELLANTTTVGSEASQLESPPIFILRLYAVVYVFISGIAGTQAVTYAKALSILIRVVAHGDRRWLDVRHSPFLYIIIVAWCVCMAFWLIRCSRALWLYDSLFIVPLLQVVWMLLSVVQGGVYFSEFNHFTRLQFAYFGLGMFLIINGVVVLSLIPARPSSSLEDDGVDHGDEAEVSDEVDILHESDRRAQHPTYYPPPRSRFPYWSPASIQILCLVQ